MARHYPNAGLTEELFKRLVNELQEIKRKHKRGFNELIRTVRNCDMQESRNYSQKFCNVVAEHSRLTPNTLEDMKGLISDKLVDDLQAYLVENFQGRKAQIKRKHVSFERAGLPEELFKRYCDEIEAMREEHGKGVVLHIQDIRGCTHAEASKASNALCRLYQENNRLTPRKLIQIEGLLSNGLFSDITDFVLDNYNWPDELDDDIARIAKMYRSEKLGRNKPSVKHYLYRAYALGV